VTMALQALSLVEKAKPVQVRFPPPGHFTHKTESP
jgi:hypothetical protein